MNTFFSHTYSTLKKISLFVVGLLLVVSIGLFTAHHASADLFWDDPVVLQKTYNTVVIKSQVKTSTVDKSYLEYGLLPDLTYPGNIPGQKIYSTDPGVVCEEVDPSVKKKWCIFTLNNLLQQTKYYFATTRENQTLSERSSILYVVTKERPLDDVVVPIKITSTAITGENPVVAPPDPTKTGEYVAMLEKNKGLPANCPDGQTSCYQLNSGFAALLGDKLNVISSATTLGEFINALLVVIIGIGSILSVFLIMYNGILFWKNDDNPAKKNVVKKNIINILSGYLLLLCTFIILGTINPDLLNLTPRIDAATLERIEQTAERTSDGTPILTGGGDPTSDNDVVRIGKNITTYDELFKKYAKLNNQSCNLLKATMYRESGGNPNAKSGVGAVGLMQFMPKTAQGLGYSVSDMYNPEKAIKASAEYYKGISGYGCNGKQVTPVCDARQAKYATAAYNGGPGANTASSACAGKTYWECTLNEKGPGYKETRHYSATVLNNIAALQEKGWGCD